MSTPLIVNRAPAPRTVRSAAESVRFSVRDLDAEVIRNSLQFYLGYGPAFWDGGVLPEEHETTDFLLRAMVGAPSLPATRELDGDVLVLTKDQPSNQEAAYEFGGLQSPAEPDAPLMLEFELELASGGVVADGNDWSGVFCGFKINDTGVAIKFIDDGVKKIEIHDINTAAVTPPSGTYSATYDWDQAQPHVYKLLWYPREDRLRLYVSSGMEGVAPDTLLIDGNISDFPSTLLPADIPSAQPTAYFGHAGPSATSVSRWSSVSLHNLVTRPVVDGVIVGGHTGFIATDDVVDYRPTTTPRSADRPWVLLPDSFGPLISGEEELSVEGHLTVRRIIKASSYGFYRIEPKVAVGPTIIDFRLWGRINNRSSGIGEASGIEVFCDDGTSQCVLGFLESGAGQSVGFYIGGAAHEAASYVSLNSGWGTPTLYRLILDPASGVTLVSLFFDDNGAIESEVLSVPYASLPATAGLAPVIGFRHNGNTIEALTELFLSQFRYSTDVRIWEATASPAGPWVKVGSQIPAAPVDGVFTIDDALDIEALYYRYPEAGIGGSGGMFMEALGAISSYEVDGVVDKTRELTGVGLVMDDGLNQYPLLFADGGPDLGRIVFLASIEDWKQNLIDLRAGKEYTVGTHFPLDWTQFHHYRIEKTVGGNISVYVDQSPVAELQFPEEDYVAQNSPGDEGVKFGSLMEDRKSQSLWRVTRHGRSRGYDVKALPTEADERFEHFVNAIVEVES